MMERMLEVGTVDDMKKNGGVHALAYRGDCVQMGLSEEGRTRKSSLRVQGTNPYDAV